MERRLAAILATDVVGYSRLIRADEEGTIAALKALRADIIDPKLTEHHGRIVKLMGDGMLAEFPSVVDAVRAAVETQAAVAEHNADLPKDKRIEFRVGINLGDVVIDGDDIQGDGVNVAARLEGMSEPGGICISGGVYDQVRDRIDAPFKDLGEQEVKNIDRPVRVWQWVLTASTNLTTDEAPLPLPDKPSIAVLPFDNMSGDPEQEYFSDGMTEDIITALSKFRWFFVTARNSTFAYKGTPIDIKRVGEELGVRYVLEGSVRKAGNRIRITAQLVEAASGNHIWAERYDRELDDVFELQDEITRTIAAAVEPELASSERQRSARKPTLDLRAWDLVQRGAAKIYQYDHEGLSEGAKFMKQAIALDPNFGQAHGYLAYSKFFSVLLGWAEDRETAIRDGVEYAKRAISIDPRDYHAHNVLGRLLLLQGHHDGAIQELEMSVTINPSFANGYLGLSAAMILKDNFEKTLRYVNQAIALSPNDPNFWGFLVHKGLAYRGLGQLDRAIETYEVASRTPAAQYSAFLFLAAAYVEIGRLEEAAAPLRQAREMEPKLSIAYIKDILNHMLSVKLLKQMADHLREAGLPEG